jgi:hypothetical protein
MPYTAGMKRATLACGKIAAASLMAFASAASAAGGNPWGNLGNGEYNAEPINSTVQSQGADGGGGCGSDGLFNESSYLSHNPDVAAAVKKGDFKNGCEHFQKWGYKENRVTHEPAAGTTDSCTPPAGFDADYYAKQSDKGDLSDQLLAYWNSHGDNEVHLCSGSCDLKTWLCKHYAKWGQGEGRAISAAESACTGLGSAASRCGPDFDEGFYLSHNGDVGAVMGKYRCAKRTFTDACSHYLTYGQFEMSKDGHIRLTHEGQKDPADQGLTQAQLDDLRQDISIWGRDVYTGPVPLIKQPLGCHVPGTPPDAFSPLARECTPAEVAAHNAGGKPLDCGPNSSMVFVGGTVVCAQNMYGALSTNPEIAGQAAEIKAYLMARNMSEGAAEYALHTLAPCNLQATTCMPYNFRGGWVSQLSASQPNEPGFSSLNWLLFSYLFAQTGAGQYNGAAPAFCTKGAKGYKDYCAPPPAVVVNTPAPAPAEIIGQNCGIAGKPVCTSCRMPGTSDFSPARPICPAGINGWNGH